MLDQVVKGCLDIAAVEQKPVMEGRRMVMIIGPRAGVIRPASSSGPTASPSRPGDQENGPNASDAPAPPSSGPRFGAPPSQKS
jgi:hypothetical protein